MTFKVRVLRRAKQDLTTISDWIAERSPAGAARWITAFEMAREKLAENPERFGLSLQDARSRYELRQFFFKTPHGRTYRGIFVIEADEVLILRVRGPGQPPLQADELE